MKFLLIEQKECKEKHESRMLPTAVESLYVYSKSASFFYKDTKFELTKEEKVIGELQMIQQG